MHLRFVVSSLICIFGFSLSLKSVNKTQSLEPRTKTLWIVDGVALNDSVFDYSLEQMRSDSASVLASRALSWVYESGIKSISVIDSVKAAEDGFINCSGAVKIATTIRKPLLFVINGYIYKSVKNASAGEILGGYDMIQHIIQAEFKDLKECGIIESRVISQMYIGCHQQRYPLVIITTEQPYFRADFFVGKYSGKRGRQSFELTLNADSTYTFQKKSYIKNKVHEIRKYGRWNISDGDIILNSLKDHGGVLNGCSLSLNDVHLKINSARKLSLLKNSWDNKKSITLNRQQEETDP